MKRINWQIVFGLALIVLSAIVYFIHYFIFRDPHHIFIYMIGDIAFVFIEVLLVTLIIHQMLTRRENRIRLEKMNMVIGAFFSEVGNGLLARFSKADPGLHDIQQKLMITGKWSEMDFSETKGYLKNHAYEVDIQKIDLHELRALLLAKRNFLLRLLENPVLLEYEAFTDLLRTVFHFTEELDARSDVTNLPASDLIHLAGDINRAYTPLASQWLDYMRYLGLKYPYLFSLAIRTNPFDKNASPLVK